MKWSLIIIKFLTLVIFVNSRRLKGASNKINESDDVSTRTRRIRNLAGKGKGTSSGTGTGKGKGTGSGTGTGKGKGSSETGTNCDGKGKGKGKGGSRDTHSTPCNNSTGSVLISNDANWYN